jgi:hypothetical protein
LICGADSTAVVSFNRRGVSPSLVPPSIPYDKDLRDKISDSLFGSSDVAWSLLRSKKTVLRVAADSKLELLDNADPLDGRVSSSDAIRNVVPATGRKSDNRNSADGFRIGASERFAGLDGRNFNSP